ncbi:flavodoxin [Methylocella silvestris BL2]|uniref:Flavodoxin n=1 Tax=Methylocella silvestris (strain DSM 15510 / CIP 108128 / LMG 27833 / NCIMB 13906 / BL2) TaxID=395965 RepID=B8EQ89_METSB|nr:flavodoxin FldA [Methylocella silvestris]ACK51579.1 flavodoxin [Methylocella silvestris BL2]
MSITIIFGSDGGATKGVASKIASKCQARSVDIKVATTEDFENCHLLILGSPTYGDGTLQSDWEEHIGKLRSANLKGKKVALFGTGDQQTYPSSFLNAMGILYDEISERGANVVGFTETAGFDYLESTAERDGKFVGLALDLDTQSGKTEKRVTAWLSQLL